MSNATLEQIIEQARSLSPDEQRELCGTLNNGDAQEPTTTPKPYNNRKLEQEWIAKHKDDYVGQWVVIEGDQLIVHGTAARTVYEAARAAGIKVPFLVRVHPADDLPFGGW